MMNQFDWTCLALVVLTVLVDMYYYARSERRLQTVQADYLILRDRVAAIEMGGRGIVIATAVNKIAAGQPVSLAVDADLAGDS